MDAVQSVPISAPDAGIMVLYSMRTRTRHHRRKAYDNATQIYEQSG